jgi:predicted Rossmann fold nucleotide-binding protein DprA/Smf involved in DNA uptake
VAVVGSRDYPDLNEVREFVANEFNPQTDILVSGGARGVDKVAEDTAKEHGVHASIIRALWDHYPVIAGHMRNPIIVDMSDEVVAFQHNGSGGTQGTIDEARRVGKPVTVFTPNGEPARY